MKVVILAGGYGTRISEESYLKPKPMLEIGDRPILWHIMKYFSSYGFNEFVICLGYKGICIKEYFEHYYLRESDVTFKFENNSKEMIMHHTVADPWTVTLAETGLDTMTGGRVRRVREYLGGEPFFLTYGDGVSNVPIDKELAFHKSHGKLVTVTAVKPSGRFGVMKIKKDGMVQKFAEKPAGDGNWINAGYFICEPAAIDYIEGDSITWENEPITNIIRDGQLCAFRHDGFWGCMDTMRDKEYLNALWNSGSAPWKNW